MPSIGLSLYKPLPSKERLTDIEIETQLTTVEWTTEMPGGFGRCSIGLPLAARSGDVPGYLPRPLGSLAGREHGEVYVGSKLVFEGQVIEITRVGGIPRALLLEGYGGVGLGERIFRSSLSEGDITSGQLVAEALALLPHISLDMTHFDDPGLPQVPSEFDGMAVSEIIDRIVKTGSADGRLWDWAIWEGPTFVLQPRTPPERSDWIAKREGIEETISYEKLVTRVSVEYEVTFKNRRTGEETTLKGETIPVSDADLEDRIGRPLELRLSGQAVFPVSAGIIQRAWLARYSQPVASIRLSGDALYTAEGEQALPWLVRAGQWVEVYGEPKMIVRTSYRAYEDSLEVELGEPFADFLEAWTRQRKGLSAIAAELHPETKAPRRR